VPFLRLNRDRRGYESTFLLHTPYPGARPRVLYWYRTAPSVRVGRPPLDEDAIRTIEEQHPDVEFNWSEILAVGAAINVEIESPTPPRRRVKPPRVPAPEAPVASRAQDAAEMQDVEEPLESSAAAPIAEPPAPRAHDLLEELVGREIATRLHARYAELSARISELATDEATREGWRVRAEPLNPDLWVTPDEILSGVQRADSLFDQLRRELLAHG
jgi:hypothetical protein